MCAISRSSAPSARCAAKWAICGLKQHTISAVASTMARQNAKIASGASRNAAGKRAGSGSNPTQTSESCCSQACCKRCMKPIACSPVSCCVRALGADQGEIVLQRLMVRQTMQCLRQQCIGALDIAGAEVGHAAQVQCVDILWTQGQCVFEAFERGGNIAAFQILLASEQDGVGIAQP